LWIQCGGGYERGERPPETTTKEIWGKVYTYLDSGLDKEERLPTVKKKERKRKTCVGRRGKQNTERRTGVLCVCSCCHFFLTVFSSSSFVYYESIRRELKIKPIDECRCDERHLVLVYYESIKRDLKTRPTYECRCDERLKDIPEESTFLTYTGFLGELEHLKIETRLIDEMFASVMGEYVFSK
jgi:hypothetical protein